VITFGSLFAGIGGFDLGFERAGMVCKWQVEIDPFCQRVLAKHWPDVQRFEDVRNVGRHNLQPVDVICGGFPCQDISNAGKQAGIDGERSGLWSEFARIICELRPRYVVVENVAALLVRGMGRVLGDLAESGYDAIWQVLSAAEFGAPHQRDRLFVLGFNADKHNANGAHRSQKAYLALAQRTPPQAIQEWHGWESKLGTIDVIQKVDSYADAVRVVYGIPNHLDRLRALGNAVVPQVAEWIGRRIVEADR
jgi:DNA (cytosine-5)-methyltransferase 1